MQKPFSTQKVKDTLMPEIGSRYFDVVGDTVDRKVQLKGSAIASCKYICFFTK